MQSLTQYYTDRQNTFRPIEKRWRKPRRFFQLEAEILTHEHPGMFAVSVVLYAADRPVDCGRLILTQAECASSERAWLAGYNLAQRLAHKYAAQSLFIRDLAESRRQRAA